jgi:hypothetical protein
MAFYYTAKLSDRSAEPAAGTEVHSVHSFSAIDKPTNYETTRPRPNDTLKMIPVVKHTLLSSL